MNNRPWSRRLLPLAGGSVGCPPALARIRMNTHPPSGAGPGCVECPSVCERVPLISFLPSFPPAQESRGTEVRVRVRPACVCPRPFALASLRWAAEVCHAQAGAGSGSIKGRRGPPWVGLLLLLLPRTRNSIRPSVRPSIHRRHLQPPKVPNPTTPRSWSWSWRWRRLLLSWRKLDHQCTAPTPER